MLKTYSDKDNYIQGSENSPRNASVEERTREMKSEGEREVTRDWLCVYLANYKYRVKESLTDWVRLGLQERWR